MKPIIVKLALAGALALLMGNAGAKQVELNVGLGNTVLPAETSSRVFVKVGLTGFDLLGERRRTPANVAIVLDRSGSMQGDKIRRAREAATMAVDLLDQRDFVSIVSYDDSADVVVPATRLNEPRHIKRQVRRITPRGSTALYAGVSKGAGEVRKFFSRQRVNRVILISDGLANIGPSSPSALGSLGASFGEEGISVTTVGLGLGYNEDLMTRLAQRSDGNHAFAESAQDLARIFRSEFGDVLSVVAQDVNIHMSVPEGVRPVRVLGRDAEIRGRDIELRLQQVYSRQEKYLIVELEVPPGQDRQSLELLTVSVDYDNMDSGERDELSRSVVASYSVSDHAVASGRDKAILSDAEEQKSVEETERAVRLRDEGRVEEAQQVLRQAAEDAREKASLYESAKLKAYSDRLQSEAEMVAEPEAWNKQRKALRKDQYRKRNQLSY